MFAEPILHVDMDAFFVEVERLRDASLLGKPVVVGGLGTRGVVATASYEARRYGVHSAMPMVQARKLCPHGVFMPSDHAAYTARSAEVFEILESFTPLVEGLSVDEAFLDVSGLRLHYTEPRDVAEAIRARLRSELGLPASVGVATTKLIAKLASEDAKPDGVFVVVAGRELEYLHPLPVRRLWGVGEATHAALEGLGVVTIGDVADLGLDVLVRRLGSGLGHHLYGLATGDDARQVNTEAEAKSISVEVTYERDLVATDDIERELLAHCERLGRRLRSAGWAARTLTLKVRFDDFSTITRSHTVAAPIDATHDLWTVTQQLVERARLAGRPVRLLGVGGAALVRRAEPRQASLDPLSSAALTDAADALRLRFGPDVVRPARLAERPDATPEDR